MNKIITISLFLIASLSLISQNNSEEYKTIFNKDRISHGGYGGLSLIYSQIDGGNTIITGVRGGWIIDHKVSIGFAGYGFINDLHFNNINNDATSDIAGGYGGLLIEYIFFPNSPIHISIPLLMGAGAITHADNWNIDIWDRYSDEADAYFVIEPGIELEFNLIKFMRMSAGVYYRHTSNILLSDTDKHALNGLSTGITLKFGKF